MSTSPQFQVGNRVRDVRLNATATVVKVRNDEYERMHRERDNTHGFYYHIQYDGGKFDTYVSESALTGIQTETSGQPDAKIQESVEYVYLLINELQCDDPYYRPYNDVLRVYKSAEEAISDARASHQRTYNPEQNPKYNEHIGYCVERLAISSATKQTSSRKTLFFIDNQGVENQYE